MRNVIVTGGSRGLGLEIATALAADGFAVQAVARRLTPELSEAIERLSGSKLGALEFRCCDLTDLTGLRDLVNAARDNHGPIYGLVNNAGLGTSALASQLRDKDAEELVCLNVTVPLLLTKQVLRSMLTLGSGRIVNISSIVGSRGYSGLSAYSATKAATEGFTRSLARELGPAGITVNAVAPGFIATEMTRELSGNDLAKIQRRNALKRFAEATDIAAAVRFLMGDGARNITGTVMTVDAGHIV